LRADERGETERDGSCQPREVVLVHGSKSSERRARASGGNPGVGARALSGLAAEAEQRQMLRGGRSWPSERKFGTGAASAGNAVEAAGSGAGTVGAVLISEVTEQREVQRLHLFDVAPEPSPCWLSAPAATAGGASASPPES
jgi:hypothetical protein